MSTTTATFGNVPTTADEPVQASTERRSFYQRFIDARMRQARAHVAGALSRMSDQELSELGLGADQIREIRAAQPVPMSI